MRKFYVSVVGSFLTAFFVSCEYVDDFTGDGGDGPDGGPDEIGEVDFSLLQSFSVGGEGAAEIAAFDPKTKRLFVTNSESNDVSVFDLTNIQTPIRLNSLTLNGIGAPNSVSIHDGMLAVAVEADNPQARGYIKLYDTESLQFLRAYTVGSLPDMVTFSPNGKYLVVANEGEPNDSYTIDPKGTVSIIEVADGTVVDLDFENFNGQEGALEEQGFRVFGPGATLAMDVEPEYVTISDDSTTAWVTLQENNGVAVVNLEAKQIEAILPLGFKDYSVPGNEIDPSNRDDKKELRNVPVLGIYQPDAIAYYKVNGMDYIITANEGDARDYDGFSEEERMGDFVLDPMAFPNAETLLLDENLGRLKTTTTLGDVDNDGDYDVLYNYGARSFTIWSGAGQLVYDSGNEIARKTLELTPDVFNGDDGRSDDKGAEPEAVTIHRMGDKWILFVGLERNNQVMVYDISNPSAPEFVQILENSTDVGPEGVLAVAASESPTGKDLLIVSNEVSGTVSIYENKDLLLGDTAAVAQR